MTYLSLSDEQRYFIQTALNGKNILVDACIGSGKTTSIQHLCDLYPNHFHILYLTYNKILKIDARNKIKNGNVVVTNYHGFAYSMLSPTGIQCGISDLIQTFIKSAPDIPNYDVLIIDEYQDIDQEISELLQMIKRKNPSAQIIAVGDMEQKIYDKTSLDVVSFIDLFLGDYERITFTNCFRLNVEHAAFLGRVWDKKIDGVNCSCTVEQMDVHGVIDFLAQQQPKDILCLGARSREEHISAMNVVLNQLESKYPKKFNKNTVYASISDQDAGAVEPRADSAIFTTYDSSKGLERRFCIVFDFTEDYWKSRQRPLQKYDILRNIFCVAASRGKEKIIFVKNGEALLSEETLKKSFETKYMEGRLDISAMFDFKYKEDIEKCYNLLQIKKKTVLDRSPLQISNRDELIDLSPCLGIYQEAEYFDNYNIDKDLKLKFFVKHKSIPTDIQQLSLEEKVLYLTSLETGQDRYRTQVVVPFISEDDKDVIIRRLSKRFRRDETVQVHCRISFQGATNTINAYGFADVVKDEIVYELKFVSELKHEHFLQCASYMVALNLNVGFLWNVRNNELYKIAIPDRKKFLDVVTAAITKGEVKEYGEPKKIVPPLKLLSESPKSKERKSPLARALPSFGSVDHEKHKKFNLPKTDSDKPLIGKGIAVQENIFTIGTSPGISVGAPIEKTEGLFAVIDVETNYNRDVMSIGVVVADGKFDVKGERYYVISPAHKIGGMYSGQLFRYKPEICARSEAILQIENLLSDCGVSEIFSYGSFDKGQLFELKEFHWHDIMCKAAYRQYNPKIPRDAEFCSTGRLKRGCGVEPILRMLLGDDSYYEKHNALEDALDELKIMTLLGISFDEY